MGRKPQVEDRNCDSARSAGEKLSPALRAGRSMVTVTWGLRPRLYAARLLRRLKAESVLAGLSSLKG